MSMMSPELALVDPELRRAAIEGLPPVVPFTFLAHPVPQRVAPSAQRIRFSSVVAYTALALARTCVVNIAVFAGVTVVVLILNLLA